jgi:hypothetical protein
VLLVKEQKPSIEIQPVKDVSNGGLVIQGAQKDHEISKRGASQSMDDTLNAYDDMEYESYDNAYGNMDKVPSSYDDLEYDESLELDQMPIIYDNPRYQRNDLQKPSKVHKRKSSDDEEEEYCYDNLDEDMEEKKRSLITDKRRRRDKGVPRKTRCLDMSCPWVWMVISCGVVLCCCVGGSAVYAVILGVCDVLYGTIGMILFTIAFVACVGYVMSSVFQCNE